MRPKDKIFNKILLFFFCLLIFPVMALTVIYVRLKPKKHYKPRLVWGSTPIICHSYWSRSMAKAGFESETFTSDYYSLINKRSDWDRIASEEYHYLWWPLRPFAAFIFSLIKYDVFFISFDGYFIGNTPLRYFQAQFLRMARKKVVLIPYGGDSYVYRNIRSTATLQGLMMSYPQASKEQDRIFANVRYWTKYADVVLPGFIGPDGLGRWDVITPSPAVLDLEMWQSSKRNSISNGKSESVVIVHAPNHRGIKGSEFIISSIDSLKKEGIKIKFILLEKMQNDEIKRILSEEADILVDQIIMTGHGLNALEGMASGLPTISNLEDSDYIVPLRRWSYFDECPLVSATPENLIEVLRKLITRPELRKKLGIASRAYVEKYHGFDSSRYLFNNVVDYMYGKKDSLINLYHPLLGEYPNRLPKIQHPLANNRIVD